MSVPIYSANWATLKKITFLGAQNALFGRPQRPNAIWNFTPNFSFSTFCIFYVKMATSEWGMGREVCISLVGRRPQFCSFTGLVPINGIQKPSSHPPPPLCSFEMSFLRMGGNLNSRPGRQLSYVRHWLLGACRSPTKDCLWECVRPVFSEFSVHFILDTLWTKINVQLQMFEIIGGSEMFILP